MSEFIECVKDISKDCEDRNIVITEINYEEEYISGMEKMNWFEEELHKFYSQDKDNNGLIHGIYYYDNLYVEPTDSWVVGWYETEEERDNIFKRRKEIAEDALQG